MSLNRKNKVKIENLEDMQRALDSLPELKQQSNNIQKHVTLTCEISKIVDDRVNINYLVSYGCFSFGTRYILQG